MYLCRFCGDVVIRNMLNEIELPWNWPVITNHLEGLAFTKWKTIHSPTNRTVRLPTEDEWHVLRQLGEYADVDQPTWDLAPGNVNLEYYASECPVDMFEFGSTGFYDIVGNVWQVCHSFMELQYSSLSFSISYRIRFCVMSS